MRLACSALVVVLALPAFADDKLPTALKDYVAKEDKSFAWKLKDKTEANGSVVYTLALTSQRRRRPRRCRRWWTTSSRVTSRFNRWSSRW